jgi:hypothetical protein
MNPDKDIASNNAHYLRYGIFIPLVLLLASAMSSCYSFYHAKQDLAADLNEAMVALVSENSALWTRQDTVNAIRKMRETTNKPMIYQAYDVKFRNAALKNDAYFTLSLVDKTGNSAQIIGNKISSDSIMLVPDDAAGALIKVQGFADCSAASVFATSNQTLPGILLSLSILSMAIMLWRRKNSQTLSSPTLTVQSIANLKLTPMQRRFTRMLLDAPMQRVDKQTLCKVLWDNKTNAEESLYTLVRRTKAALNDANIEIICNRGESYELRRKC